MIRRPTRALAAALALSVAVLAASVPAASAKDLVGTFAFTPGKSKTVTKRGKRVVKVSGTYFRMLLPGKRGRTKKDFFANPNSRSKDKSFTLLRPGIDGGLRTGSFQPMPNPPFDVPPDQSSLANRIMLPEKFAGINFSLSTDATDQQSQTGVGAPIIRQKGRRLSGDLRGFTASWNGIYFNQGSPKPDGTRPGGTRRVAGTYNARTRRYTITWKSKIVGGPFGGFTGYWHLQGKFRP